MANSNARRVTAAPRIPIRRARARCSGGRRPAKDGDEDDVVDAQDQLQRGQGGQGDQDFGGEQGFHGGFAGRRAAGGCRRAGSDGVAVRGRPGAALEVEQFAQQRLRLAWRVAVAVPVAVTGLGVGSMSAVAGGSAAGFDVGEQAIQFAAIQPDSAARGAIVDLDAPAFGHGQVTVLQAGQCIWGSGKFQGRGKPASETGGGRMHLRRGTAKVLPTGQAACRCAGTGVRHDDASVGGLLPFEGRS